MTVTPHELFAAVDLDGVAGLVLNSAPLYREVRGPDGATVDRELVGARAYVVARTATLDDAEAIVDALTYALDGPEESDRAE